MEGGAPGRMTVSHDGRHSPTNLLDFGRQQQSGTPTVKTILPALLVCLLCSFFSASAQAGGSESQDWLSLPSGKSAPLQALAAKRNARCASLYGPGYGAFGDTDTCIRIGGRIGISVGTSSKQNRLIIAPSRGIGAPVPTLGGAPVVGVVRGPSYGSATTAEIYVDTHTPTEIGDFATHFGAGAVRASGALRGPDYIH